MKNIINKTEKDRASSLVPRPLSDFISQLWTSEIKSGSYLGRRSRLNSHNVPWHLQLLGRVPSPCLHRLCHSLTAKCSQSWMKYPAFIAEGIAIDLCRIRWTYQWNYVNLSLMGATGFWHREPVSWWRGWGLPCFTYSVLEEVPQGHACYMSMN